MELTTAEVAKALGVKYKYFREILMTEDVPHVERGGPGKSWKFDLAVLNRWWLEREIKKSPHQTGRMLTLNDARGAKLDAEAKMAQLQLGKMQEDLVSVSVIEPMLTRAFTAVRARLLSIPAKAAPVVRPDDPKFARECLEKMIREVLEELSAEAIDLELPDEADSDREAGSDDQLVPAGISEPTTGDAPF